jgi:hypothetical protein
VTLRLTDDPGRDAVDAQLSGCFDLIHLHHELDHGTRGAAGPVPLIATSYVQGSKVRVRQLALSRAHGREMGAEPLAIVYPSVPDVLTAHPRGDHLAFAFFGNDAAALASASAIARTCERELRVVLPAGAALSGECEHVLNSGSAARLISIENLDVRADASSIATAAAYLSLARAPFDMGALTALAQGIPVLTLERLPAAELVVGGESGYVAETVEQLSRMVDWLDSLSSSRARERARLCFSPETAAARLENVYRSVVEGTLSPVRTENGGSGRGASHLERRERPLTTS